MSSDHVKKTRRHLVELPAAQRIKIIQQNVWVDCPQSRLIINMVKNIVRSPRQVPSPCLLVCGEGGAGKTAIIRQIKAASEAWDENVVFMALNENPGNLKFREHLLLAMGTPTTARNTLNAKLPEELADWVELRKIKALVIDEFHDSLISNRPDQLKTLSMLKGLSGDPYGLSIIGFGTSLAKNALRHDAQLLRRYHIHEIKPWTETETFRAFLAALEENLPLRKPSELYSAKTVKYLLSKSSGVMDNVVKLVLYGAVLAVISGEEKITPYTMDEAIANPWAYAIEPTE